MRMIYSEQQRRRAAHEKWNKDAEFGILNLVMWCCVGYVGYMLAVSHHEAWGDRDYTSDYKAADAAADELSDAEGKEYDW